MLIDRTAVFISGRGSNLQALLDCQDSVRVSLVVSSRPNNWGVARARRANVPVLVLPNKIDWHLLQQQLTARKINRIFLLGFMKIVPGEFLNNWNRRIWNLHPSLLPHFPGLHAIEKSFDSDCSMGVTIHQVTEGMDEGPRVMQALTLEAQQKSCLKLSQALTLKQAERLISRDEQKLVRKFGEGNLF